MKLPWKKSFLALALVGASGATMADAISTSICHITKLTALEKPAVDILGTAVGTFKCDLPIGLGADKSLAIVYVSERDYTAVSRIFHSQARVEFSFDGTFAGKLASYDGIAADFTPLDTKRTGITSNSTHTTFIFRDLDNAKVKTIYNAMVEVGTLKLEEENISVELSSPKAGIGELKIVVQNADVTEKILAASNGILLSNGERVANDQIEFSEHSAFVISNLLINAKMAVDRGSIHRPGHYPQAWDYVYLDKDGKNPLFHCANVHSGEIYTKCYINQLRIK